MPETLHYQLHLGSNHDPSTPVVIMPNHLTGTLEGSFGEYAKDIHDYTGVSVLAYERPGTGSQETLAAKLDDASYLEAVNMRAKQIGEVLAPYQFAQAYLFGMSAGALEALAVASTGRFMVRGVIAVEPVGFSMPLLHAEALRTANSEFRRKIRGARGSYRDSAAESSPSSIIKDGAAVFKELKTYAALYKGSIGYELVPRIRTNNSQAIVRILLARHGIYETKLHDLQERIGSLGARVQVMEGDHSLAKNNEVGVRLIKEAVAG